MDEKNNICLELYKTQIERFKDTRQIQWKINIAFWTFILVSSAFLYGKYQISICEGFWIVLSFAVLHFCWSLFIQKSLENDKILSIKYRNQLHKFLGLENALHKDNKNRFSPPCLMEDLIPLLKKSAQGRDISVLKAYE